MPTFSGIIVATGSESDGRTTLLDVVNELSTSINAADETVRALAADAFRAAVRTMNRKGNWPWECLDEDITMTLNNAFSTVSGPVKKPLSMHYTTTAGGTQNQPIIYCTYDRFLEMYSLDIACQPTIYTIPNLFETGQVRWFGVPNSAYTAKFNYYRATPVPRAEDEVLEIPETAIETYKSFAWYEFVKRLSQKRRPFPIEVALAECRISFKELCAQVNSPGDRSRAVNL
jgi:hypothetical protein